jgi:hypothetical protein
MSDFTLQTYALPGVEETLSLEHESRYWIVQSALTGMYVQIEKFSCSANTYAGSFQWSHS